MQLVQTLDDKAGGRMDQEDEAKGAMKLTELAARMLDFPFLLLLHWTGDITAQLATVCRLMHAVRDHFVGHTRFLKPHAPT